MQVDSYPCYTFKELSFQSTLGIGNFVTVVKGTIDGTSVAVKLFDTSKGGSSNLIHELEIYEQLKEYQGKFIPSILA